MNLKIFVDRKQKQKPITHTVSEFMKLQDVFTLSLMLRKSSLYGLPLRSDFSK